MLKLTAIEFIARLVPEALLFPFAAYVFSNTRLINKNYWLSCLLFGLAVFGIRLLPINFGVHTILNIIILTLITCNIAKITPIKAIKSSILTATVLFVCEGVNVVALKLMFNDKLTEIISNPAVKTIYALPSLICFAIVVIIMNLKNKKKEKVSYV